VAFLAVSVSFGPIIVFTFGVFLRPITEEFGWTRGEVSIAFSVAALTVSLTSPLIGRLTDRLGARPVVVVCATVYSAAYASLAWLTGALAQLYATYFVIGLVGNGATQLPYSRTITEWFDRRRGMALSLMMTGVGAGIVVMPPLAQYLIDNHGWRYAYLALGALMFAAAVPLPALLLRRGGAAHGAASGVAAADGMTVREAVRTPVFWTILACFFLQSAALNGCVAHLAPLLTDRGLTAAHAAMAASVMGGFTMAGRLVTGYLLDRFFAPRVAAAFFGMATAGVVVLLTPTTEMTALAAAALIGFSMGAEADAMPYLVSRYFGLRSFTELFGYTFSAYAVAGALGPGLMGLGFDRFGDYRATIAGLAVTIGLGSLLMLRLPRFDSVGPARIAKENLNHAAHSTS
jgi:MFS family permease